VADDSGTPHGVFGAFWRRLMEHRIQVTRRDQRDVYRVRMPSQKQSRSSACCCGREAIDGPGCASDAPTCPPVH
jgi:hypothetical protein